MQMPPGGASHRFRIDDLLVDVGRRAVLRGSSEIHLSRLSFALLRTLIEAAPNVVSNEQLAHAVWQGVVVNPETVTQRVKVLRDALGDNPAAPRYIAGLRGQGYRLVPAVIALSDNPTPSTSGVPGGRPHTTRPRIAAIALSAVAIILGAGVLVSTVPGWLSPSQAPVPPASTAPPIHSIAVLPFLDLSEAHNDAYLADGIAEELITSLARIKELQVAARTSSFSFQGQHADIATVAHKLNVATVLEGSVHRSEHTIHITAQLVDGASGFHVWSQTYDRDLGDLVQLQTELATEVARALKVTPLGDTAARIAVGETHDPAALDAYLRASKTYWTNAGLKDVQTAIALYTEAIRIDPGYALAYAARSSAERKATDWASTMTAVHAGLLKARADALKATTLAPDLSEGHLALAVCRAMALEFTEADHEYERALTLEPGNARVLRVYASFAVAMGRDDAGLSALRRALALDPLNRQSQMFLGSSLITLRRYAEALEALREAEALEPPQPGMLADTIGITYYLLGDYENARIACEKMSKEYLGPYCLAMTYRKLGRHSDAEAMLAKDRTLEGDTGDVHLSQIYAQWGNTAQSLDSLETAMRLREPDLNQLRDPLFDPIRKEPRFQAIERALNFPE